MHNYIQKKKKKKRELNRRLRQYRLGTVGITVSPWHASPVEITRWRCGYIEMPAKPHPTVSQMITRVLTICKYQENNNKTHRYTKTFYLLWAKKEKNAMSHRNIQGSRPCKLFLVQLFMVTEYSDW